MIKKPIGGCTLSDAVAEKGNSVVESTLVIQPEAKEVKESVDLLDSMLR